MNRADAGVGASVVSGGGAAPILEPAGLLDRIVETDNISVVGRYEQRISSFEAEKLLMEEKLTCAGKPRYTMEESFEHAFQFLSSPWKIWEISDLMWRRAVLRLAFLEPVAYI